MGERNVPGQLGLFHLNKTTDESSDGLGLARWLYPCGLCNGADVAEAGGLCASCAPVPVRKATRRRTTAGTKTTAGPTKTKTTARPVRKGTPRKVSPAQVKTAMQAMRWCA